MQGFHRPSHARQKTGFQGRSDSRTRSAGRTSRGARALLSLDDDHERRRALSFLNHPRYLEPLRAAVDDESLPAGDAVGAIGELYTAAAPRALLELALDVALAILGGLQTLGTSLTTLPLAQLIAVFERVLS